MLGCFMPTLRPLLSIFVGSWLCMGANACASGAGGEESQQNPMVGPSAGAGGQLVVELPPDEVECYPDANCTCADGRMGAVSCAAEGAGTCECDHCPQFMAAAIPSFNACGGEPFGMWELEAMTSPALDVYVTERDAQGVPLTDPVSCTGTILEATTAKFIIDLQDGGGLRHYRGYFDITVDVLEQCIEHSVGRRCDTVQIGNGECQDLCGVCECNMHMSGLALIDYEWARTTTVLSLGGWDYQYCVQGDTLTLRDVSQLDFRMRRVTESSSTPVACSDRTMEQCASGCALGACAGTGDCAGASEESNCTNRQGCSWDPLACTGTPQPCSLGDYGVIPGCTLTPVSP